MPDIKASVGIAKGKQCYNTVADQLTVIGMFNQLPGFSGGTADNPLDTSPRWGFCSPRLYQAILDFQARYSLPQDGHIDPGGRTIRTLAAAIGDQLPAAPIDDLSGPAAKQQMQLASNAWRCDDLSTNNLGVVDEVGINIYSGSIKFVGPDGSAVTYPIKGGGPSAGLTTASFFPEDNPASAAPQAQKALQWVIENVSGSYEKMLSSTTGVCAPFGDDLTASSFTGACWGGIVADGATILGGSMAVLFFGMPRACWGGIGFAQLLSGSGPLGMPIALPLAAATLYQANGVVLLGSGGFQGSLGIGVSFTSFYGWIG